MIASPLCAYCGPVLWNHRKESDWPSRFDIWNEEVNSSFNLCLYAMLGVVYETNEYSGVCDVTAVVGDKHIKISCLFSWGWGTVWCKIPEVELYGECQLSTELTKDRNSNFNTCNWMSVSHSKLKVKLEMSKENTNKIFIIVLEVEYEQW